MQPSNVTEQIEKVRQQSIAVLDALVAKAEEFELAKPPEALERYRRKLRENSYKVLVVGEAKRGKSTFVNALIGRDILPTDVDVATSQVFNIRPSEREAYRLRFEDGSAREITVQDLPRYGSQVMIDAGVVPTADQIIRWIEVDAPIRFLPRGVSILDTPALGTLYAGHARITHRFVPEADAVIFVLESGQPVVEEDLKFIEQIMTVTRNIFFVQTKIDRYNKEDWQNVRRRSQEILAQRFKGQLDDTRVWPVSSANLRKAAASADEKTREAYLMVSQYRELAAALRAFLARVAGWGRTAEAMAVAARYYGSSGKALAGRLTGLTAESEQKQAELQKIAVESKRQFDAEWGAQGQKYKELREGLQRAIAVAKKSFANMLQPGSDIEMVQKAKIEAITSLSEANQIAETMPGEVISEAMDDWAVVCKEVQSRCIVLLEPFVEAVEVVGAPLDHELSGLRVTGEDSENRFKHDYFTMFRSALGGGTTLISVGSMASLAGISLTGMLGMVAPFVAVPVLAGMVYSGVKGVLKGQTKAAQGQLRMQLAEVLQKVRRHFFDVDLATGNFSRVDEYFNTLERTVNEQVRAMVEKKSKESQAEISRLAQSAQLSGREREARIEQTRQQLAQWDKIGKSAKDIMGRMEALKRPQAPTTA